jgi:hypothetical protein
LHGRGDLLRQFGRLERVVDGVADRNRRHSEWVLPLRGWGRCPANARRPLEASWVPASGPTSRSGRRGRAPRSSSARALRAPRTDRSNAPRSYDRSDGPLRHFLPFASRCPARPARAPALANVARNRIGERRSCPSRPSRRGAPSSRPRCSSDDGYTAGNRNHV